MSENNGSKEQRSSTLSLISIPYFAYKRHMKGLYYKQLFSSLDNTPEDEVANHPLGVLVIYMCINI